MQNLIGFHWLRNNRLQNLIGATDMAQVMWNSHKNWNFSIVFLSNFIENETVHKNEETT